MNNQLAAIILAAGRGKRMQLTAANKVTLQLADKPIIRHIVDFMKHIAIRTIVVVVGYHKESVIKSLEDQKVIFAEQKELLGTGNALVYALEELPEDITDVLVVYGDDAVLYSEENASIIQKLIKNHNQDNNAISFLTIEQENPSGLGRIVREKDGTISSIVEDKDATEEQKKIKEINPGCFIISVEFLKKYLLKLEKSPVTQEFYLTGLIDLAVKNEEKVYGLNAGNLNWRGINTKEELEEAKKFFNN
ncbi:NTP transferase domain-containing protein [Candidatus Roizmanbacteria bacterium]|nr:NTP transferase domain-containing protein [Candidatus Roizmanbacteria bacterium]